MLAQLAENVQGAQNRHYTMDAYSNEAGMVMSDRSVPQHSMSVLTHRLWLSLPACHADSLLISTHSMQQHHLSSYTDSLRCVPPTTSSCLPEPPMAASTQLTFAPCTISCSSGVLAPPPPSAHAEPAGSAAVQSQRSTRLSLAPETSRWPLPSAKKHLHGPLVYFPSQMLARNAAHARHDKRSSRPEPYVPQHVSFSPHWHTPNKN